MRDDRDPAERRRIHRSRAINAFGACFTGLVLVVVLVTKFTHGAYLVVIAIPVLCVMMRASAATTQRCAPNCARHDGEPSAAEPGARVVLVSSCTRPTLRALAFADADRPGHPHRADRERRRRGHQGTAAEWEERDIQVPLKVIESPYREITRPVVDYIKELRKSGPRDVVDVYIPEYVVGRWWENLLHNQSALRLKGRLLFEPGSWSPACRGSCAHRSTAIWPASNTSPAKSVAALTAPRQPKPAWPEAVSSEPSGIRPSSLALAKHHGVWVLQVGSTRNASGSARRAAVKGRTP